MSTHQYVSPRRRLEIERRLAHINRLRSRRDVPQAIEDERNMLRAELRALEEQKTNGQSQGKLSMGSVLIDEYEEATLDDIAAVVEESVESVLQHLFGSNLVNMTRQLQHHRSVLGSLRNMETGVRNILAGAGLQHPHGVLYELLRIARQVPPTSLCERDRLIIDYTGKLLQLDEPVSVPQS